MHNDGRKASLSRVDEKGSKAGWPQLGAAFYQEYLPNRTELSRHFTLMREAGLTSIRVGESVWSTWEPNDGEFNLEWLAPVLDAACEHSIGVILGTPTYAVPPWLARKHPEFAITRVDGGTVRWGARQEVDFTSPGFRRYAERIIRAVLGRYGDHAAVVGVQLDNEPGLHLIANDHVVAGFRRRLRETYKTVGALNDAWQLDHWSHRISEWDDLWTPGGNTTPAYDLAWRRYQADLTTDFISWQAGIAREIVPPERFVTTCIAYNRAAVDDVALGNELDVVSGNAYLDVQDALDINAASEHGPDFWYTTSPAGLFQQADRMRSSQGGRFLVTETGATSIAGSHLNFPPYDGQLAQIAWALVARGAGLIEYWHWHTLHSGAEQTWGGILGHDLEPGRIYAEVAAIGAAFEVAGSSVAGLIPQEDIGILFSRESRWAMQFQPPLTVGSTRQADRWSYDRTLSRFAEAALEANLQAGVVAVEQLTTAEELLERFPVLVVAAASVLADDAAAILCQYALLGGRVVLGIRTGAADELGRARVSTLPGPFREIAGVRIRESSNLRAPVPLTTVAGDSDGGEAEAWADAIELEGATELLRYQHPHFGRWAAAAEHNAGKGIVLTIGTLPDRATLATLLGKLSEGSDRGRTSALVVPNPPHSVSIHGARNARGDTVWLLHNWSAQSATVEIAVPLIDVLDSTRPVVRGSVSLPPRGVRVLLESVFAGLSDT